MRVFKNKNTGIVEQVTNEKLVAQYLAHKEVYEEVKAKSEGANLLKNKVKQSTEVKEVLIWTIK